MNRIQHERGIALAVAIFALVVVGGLVSAAFFVGVQEQRVGRNTVKLQQAFSAAEAGTQATINGWTSSSAYNGMATGASSAISYTQLASSAGWYKGTVTRINNELFLISIEGFSQDSTARQRVGIITRLRVLELNVNAALKSRGNLKLGGSSFIDGRDHVPTGWTGCEPLRDTIPAIRLPGADSANITYSGCTSLSCLAGDPKIKPDNTINDSTLSHFGDAAFDDLRSMANKFPSPGTLVHVSPSLTGTDCNTGDVMNWGDPLIPTDPCGGYFPIIWIDGDASINGDYGQGILIINGDLTVQGGFEFFGPVIVKGSMKTTGTGGHFNGGVIARNVDLEQETILGDAVINFSSCALNKALNKSATGAPMRERSWVNMY